MNTNTIIHEPETIVHGSEHCEDQEFLRALLEYSPDYIYFKDLESRFRRSSKALCDRFGVTPDEIIGKTDFDFFDASRAQPAFDDEQEIVRTGISVLNKIEREITKDGAERWDLTSKMPLRNQNGDIIGTFGISKDITALKQAEAKLSLLHKELVETSRSQGMAEVAITVLHNVGNVLNSVNVSASLVADRVRDSRVANLSKAAALLQEHNDDLSDFLTRDAKGRQFPAYLAGLAQHLMDEQKDILKELTALCANIQHIKEIVAMQQAYASVSGTQESLSAQELADDALQLNAGAVERHKVRVTREYAPTPNIIVDKHKVLQILVNLIRNAKYALDERGHTDKQLILRTSLAPNHMVRISVIDNGVGVPPENLVRIFAHGFTTRREGHGFGLHSGALAAKQLGGSLACHSDGPGKGATFILELPIASKGSK